ncbi:MAG: efflux RND transporter periplasmic adaptor subunit [Bacteroidetes bacterium]|nr:efflux RND transporter periplasmic adaptor subunit [Bacteroidota bacterium]
MNILNPSRFKTFTGFTAMLFSVLLFSSCSSEEPAALNETAVNVQVATAQAQTSGSTQGFPGNVESNNQANLSTIVMGTVTEVPVSIGQNVKKGEVLARIKDDQIRAKKMQLEANMVQAKANLENTEKNLNRIQNLYEEESATSKELDDISTMYDIARANVEALEASMREVNEMLEYTVVRAPFDGIVSRKFVSAGDMAAPGHPLVAVSDPGTLKITANVPARWIGEISEGDSVTVSVSAAGIDAAGAVLTAVSNAGDPMSRQYAIEAQITDPEAASQLKTGMFAEIGIRVEGADALYIPTSALVQRGQLTGVYTLSDKNRTVLRWVRAGKTAGETVEILTGLTPGEQYIASMNQPLRQGQLVNIQ